MEAQLTVLSRVWEQTQPLQVPPRGLFPSRALPGGWEISRLCLTVTSDPFRQCILSGLLSLCVSCVCPCVSLAMAVPTPSRFAFPGGSWTCLFLSPPAPRKPRALFPGCEKAAELIPDYPGSPLLWLCRCSPSWGCCVPQPAQSSLCRPVCGPGLWWPRRNSIGGLGKAASHQRPPVLVLIPAALWWDGSHQHSPDPPGVLLLSTGRGKGDPGNNAPKGSLSSHGRGGRDGPEDIVSPQSCLSLLPWPSAGHHPHHCLPSLSPFLWQFS